MRQFMEKFVKKNKHLFVVVIVHGFFLLLVVNYLQLFKELT